jgi:peptide-methionine (S)-S-oxide reductase
MKYGFRHIKAELFLLATFFIASVGIGSCSSTENKAAGTQNKNEIKVKLSSSNNMDTVTFGAGCFWCVEAVFQRLKGVQSVKSGYSGGTVKNPSYKEVCNGTTGHAEVCQLVYNKDEISFEELLEVFWKTHDPTTLNSQGNDFGTQYRSVIFYHSEEQKLLAEKYKAKLNEAKAYENPVVTEITAFSNFYPAEDYHQNYFNTNGSQTYCKFVIQPKLEKFEKVFKDKIKH